MRPHESASDATGRPDGEMVPDVLGGMSLEELRNDYQRRLFEQYLPFWERGGYDRRYGGFMCELNDDGSVFCDEKFLSYQGRAIWAYSFLYNNLDRDRRWLEAAAKTRDFMADRMYAGEGRWIEKARRDGTPLEGVGQSVLGGLYAAAGLVQYHIAAGRAEDMELAATTLRAAVNAYDDANYVGAATGPCAADPLPAKGLRSQGHSMILVWTLSQLLSVHEDSWFERLRQFHVDALIHRFWNPAHEIVNEHLHHDYSRIAGAEGRMYAGHSIEAMGMVLDDALRVGDRAVFETAATRIRRLLDACWDREHGGWADGEYVAFDMAGRRRGPDYDLKTMFAHCEIMIACLTLLEYAGQAWAKPWYDRTRAFLFRTMAADGDGAWKQAVDRRGNDAKRAGVSAKRKDNFHPARMLMLNLLSLNRILGNQRQAAPLPDSMRTPAFFEAGHVRAPLPRRHAPRISEGVR